MKIETNKWINIDDLCAIPQEVGTRANYAIRGYVYVGNKEPDKNTKGFFIEGKFCYTKQKGENLWVKIVR